MSIGSPFVRILSLAALAVSPAFAGHVTQTLADNYVLILQEKEAEFAVEEKVCFVRDGQRIGCGIVTAATTKGAKAKVTEMSRPVKKEDSVVKESEAPAAAAPLTPVAANTEATTNAILGIKQNLSTANAFVQFQFATNQHVAFGLRANLLNIGMAGTNRVIAMGGDLSVEYYSRGGFEGLWMELGTGFDILPTASTGIGGTTYAPVVIGQFGWRAKWALGLNIGVALSAHYYLKPYGIAAEFDFNPIQPMLSADIGFKF